MARRPAGRDRRRRQRPEITERAFWKLIDQSSSRPEACWMWRGDVDAQGYGLCRVKGYGSHFAHRLAYRLTRGVWPKITRHTCDIRGCARPSHLLNGTHDTNEEDKRVRGRAVGKTGIRGITKAQARGMVRLYAAGWTQARIAEVYGVTRQAVGYYLTGQGGRVARVSRRRRRSPPRGKP